MIAQLVERRTVEVHKSFPLAGCSNHPREIHRSAVGAIRSQNILLYNEPLRKYVRFIPV